MQFPLDFWNFSLWLAFNAVTLLITSELVSTPRPQSQVVVDKKRLRTVASLLGVAFMITVLIHAYQ